MPSEVKQHPPEPEKIVLSLEERIEQLAGKLIVGGLEEVTSHAMLQGIREAARQIQSFGVERCVNETLDALSSAAGKEDSEDVLSGGIEAMRRALRGKSSSGSATVLAPVAGNSGSGASEPAFVIDDPALMSDFVMEARDHLAQVELQMLTLEKEPGDRGAIDTVFRGFHTIKGLAGFLGLEDIREVAHETESLLDLARRQELRINSTVVDVVLAAADFLKACLNGLTAALEGGRAEAPPDKRALLESIRRSATGAKETKGETGTAAAAEAEVPATVPEAAPQGGAFVQERRSGEDRRASSEDLRSVKVQTSKLDFLVDMAGELVIVQSMVRHQPELAALRSPAALRSLAQLERITGELQKTAMSMRMVPVNGLFQKMSRLVRDVARKTGKQVEMESMGGDTELDRNVVEELADPLVHMIRNAVDHGVEGPEERLAAGKTEAGHVRLSASHQAGHIVISIADDGRGLMRSKIVDKAMKTGLIESDAGLSDREVFDLIFAPGFSTSAAVTDVSGRGVGMDVVKKQIQKLRGHVDIESVPGQGTTFQLWLPLTLAMIDGLVVGVGKERYVVPLFSVREMLRPTPEMLFSVENRHEMAMVRNSLMPMVRLHERFHVEPRSRSATDGLWIVAEAAGKTFCLMVDELIGKQEVVIKSLGESLKDLPGIAGGAILGDGRVALILDLESVFRSEARCA